MSHEMLCNSFVAVLAFFALSIRFYLFLLRILDRLVIMHSNQLHVDFDIFSQNECLGVNVPPITTLVFDKITN